MGLRVSKLLLDTHVLLWFVTEKQKLSARMLASIENTDTIFASAITCFELLWLHHHNKIELPCVYDEWFQLIIDETGIQFIDITPTILHTSVLLPEHHKDPHDRIIISTALHYDLQLASMDSKFQLYNALQGKLVN